MSVQEVLAGTVHTIIRSLKMTKDVEEIELRVKMRNKKKDKG